MHPLIDNLDSMKENELENKINELTRKYFISNNPQVKHQISLILDDYKFALQRKREQAYQEMMQSRNKDLDNLIKVD